MTRTNKPEYANAKLPGRVWLAEPRHIDDMEGDMASVSEKVGSGRAFLKVVAYPWGVEFDVCDAEGTI